MVSNEGRIKKLINTVETISPWHFVWVGIIFSEIFTLIITTILSYLLWGQIHKDILLIGAIDAFIVAFLVICIVIHFVNRIRETNIINEDLNKEIKSRKEAEKKLHEIHQELEKRVSERTSQLDKLNRDLKESTEKFEALFNKAPISYQSLDGDGFFLEVNETWLETLGYSREEVIGKSFGDFFHPEQKACFKDKFPILKQTGNVSGFEFQLAKKDGSYRLFSLDGRISRNPDGSFQQTHCTLYDVTEQKRAEQALEKSAKEWSVAMDASSDTIILLDLNRKVLRANKAFYEATKTTPEFAIGRSASEIMHKDDPVNKRVKNCKVCQKLKELQDCVFTIEPDDPNNQTNSPIEISITIVRDEHNNPISILLIKRDLTRQREIENQLREYQNQLEIMVEDRTQELKLTHQQLLHAAKLSAIGKLSASIAHEFNNPLQGIMNILQGVLKRADLDGDDRELMEIAVKENERMRDLIKGLQDFNRPTTGKASLVDLNEIINKLLLLFKKEFKSKGINIKIDYDNHIPPVMAVSDQIQQVFLNLLNNAGAASGENDSISIKTMTKDGAAIVEVHDTGSGIAHENKDQIFEPFFTTKPEVKGTGLGLSVSYGIIKKHNGSIEVDSEHGKGSTFTVKLPLDGGLSNAQQNIVG